MASPSPAVHYHDPSREDIVANILHILSSSTDVSPLLGGCSWGEVDEKGKEVISWDLFISFIESMPDIDSGIATHSNFLYNWLVEFLQILYCHQHTNMGGVVAKEEMMRIMSAFIDTSRLNKLLNINSKPDDDLLWQAGLDLLRTHVFSDEDSDMDDDDDDDDSSGSHLSLDPIPPHELLRTVMDSYYCKDDDVDVMGELSGIEAEMPSQRMYRLPSSLAMFFLRTLLTSRALESAEESIPDSSSESSKPVRWRRMKSMVDDTLSLFQRMVFDNVGKAVDGFEYGRHPKSLDIHPCLPEHIISISCWLYANHVFPSCHDLLYVLLWNDTNNSNGKAKPSGIKVLETCYDSFRMLTSLLALEVTVVDQEYNHPSRCLQWVVKRIESKSTSDFFYRVKMVQKEIPPKDGNHCAMQDDDDEEEEICYPWNNLGPGFGEKGLSLEDHLLLYPSIRKKFDQTDKGSVTFYDEMGIAVIAYWKLWAQAQPETDSLDPLPYPYSNSHRWALLFPHIITFLCASRASSTAKRMNELEILSSHDGYLIGINFTTISLGLDMLHTFITDTPAIRPTHCCTKSQNPIDRWAHSSEGLKATIGVLLSHVVRLNAFEASRGSKPPSEVYPALKYSSVQVLNMTQTLLGFYNPPIQIHTLVWVCQHIKTNQDSVVLPKAIDFMRPVIMGMCKNIEQYKAKNFTIALSDMEVMQQISNVLDLFLLDLRDTFGDGSMSPLPSVDIVEFMSFLETYSSVFAIVRLQRMWIFRCQSVVQEEVKFLDIIKWMDGCLDTLQSFDSSLTRLIDFWQRDDDRPENWHWLFLTNLALQDALTQPDE